MIDEGWLEEVKALIDTPWEPFIQHKKLIGYNELIDFVRASLHGNRTEGLLKTERLPRREIREIDGASTSLTDVAHTSLTMDTVVKTIQQRTRHYAKRQFTFWRMFSSLYAQLYAHEHKKHTATKGLSKRSGSSSCYTPTDAQTTLSLESLNLTLFSGDLYINQLATVFKKIHVNKNN